MNRNNEFEDKMHKLNTKAQNKGFMNANDWASNAFRAHEINKGQYEALKRMHNMRNQIGHGNARDLNVTVETIRSIDFYFSAMNKSKVRPDPNKRNGFRQSYGSHKGGSTVAPKKYSSAAASMVAGTVRNSNIHHRATNDPKMRKLIDIMVKKVSTFDEATKRSLLREYDAEYRIGLLSTKSKVNRVLAETLVAHMSDSEINGLLKDIH